MQVSIPDSHHSANRFLSRYLMICLNCGEESGIKSCAEAVASWHAGHLIDHPNHTLYHDWVFSRDLVTVKV
jgi:hypothetical protein